MDGISVALAVVSLAIQLGGTVNQICRSLRNVVSLLDGPRMTLSRSRGLTNQQTSVFDDLGPVMLIANAIQNCNGLITTA